MNVKKILSFFLKKILSKQINNFFNKKNIVIIFRNGFALGDQVLMTSIIKEISSKNRKKILLFIHNDEIFVNNPRIIKIYKLKNKSPIWFFLRILAGRNILEFNSVHATKQNHEVLKKYFLSFHSNNKIHLARAMSEHFDIDLEYKDLENEFFFSENELKKFENEIKLPPKFSLIQSISKHSFTTNKEWKIEGMQSIIDYFKDIKWIQIGKNDEPKLNNCQNMLSLSIREVAFVISKCQFIVTYEGFFNHLASCFQKKSFVIHTGFLPVEAFKYKNNIIIERNEKMDCYPCFKIDCKSHSKNILKHMINEYVINKIKSNL